MTSSNRIRKAMATLALATLAAMPGAALSASPAHASDDCARCAQTQQNGRW